MDDLPRCYQILDIAPSASLDEIKKACPDLVKVWHPDRFAHDAPLRMKARDKLKEINGACQVLPANQFAEGTSPGTDSSTRSTTSTPPPQPPPPSPPPEADPTARRPALWVPWSATAFLVLAVAFLAWLKLGHEGGQPTLHPAVPPALADALRRGLILDFHFDQETPGGIVADLSGHGNNAEADGVRWADPGSPESGLEFGPEGHGYLRVPDNASLNPTQFTLAAWIKTTQKDPLWRRLFDKGDWDKKGVEQGYDLTIGGFDKSTGKNWQGQVLLEVSDRASYTKTQVTDGKWHHVAGTFDGTNLQFFVDGRPAHQNQVTKPMKPTAYDLTIGHPCTDPPNEADTAGFIGRMNDVMMYDRPLAEEEVRQLFELQAGSRSGPSVPPPDQAGSKRSVASF